MVSLEFANIAFICAHVLEWYRHERELVEV